MKRDNINYLVAGSFVLLMGLALMVLLYRVTGKTGATDEYHSFYSNVAGLKYGTAVSYEGYKVGQIEKVTPEPAETGMRYRVDFSVVDGWQIPEDSIARIVATGLISAVSIDIKEGSSKTALPPGSEIKGAEQVSIMTTLNEVAEDFHVLSTEGIRPTLQNFNDRLAAVSQELIDLSRNDVRPLIAEVHKQVDDAQVLRNFNAVLARMDATVAELQTLLGPENQQHVSAILTNLRGTSADLRALVGNIEATRIKLNNTLQKLENLIDRNGPGLDLAISDLRTTMRVLSENIDTVMYQLEGSTRNLQEFTREMREDPSRLLRSRPPEETGVRR